MNNVESPLKNIVNNLKENELGASILESVIGASDVDQLKEIEKEIEQDKTIKGLEKIWKKIAINIKGNIAFGDERKEASNKEKNNKEKTKNEENSTPEEEIYDTKGILLFINKIKINQNEFSRKTKEIAKKLHINPNRLMQIMNKESGLNHEAVNKDTQATGLIQFMPNTAKGLGTTVSQLKNMSNVEQLDFVYEYYAKFGDKIRSHTDLYLATFYPAALGKPDNYIIGSEKGKQAIIGKQNKMNHGNPITVAHVKTWISKDIPGEYLAQFQTTTIPEEENTA